MMNRQGKQAVLCAGISVLCAGLASALPEGWTITQFASPPEAEYPAAISAAANGDVYISSDRNGSIGKNPEFGKIVRATDTDGDGKADEFQDFVPLLNSPRGGDFVGGTFYVIHPPYLSSFKDTDGDGVADEKKTLVKGFGWGIEHPRGADHTTNGVRMGIDGWLYVAVGDFGMPAAEGADGKKVTLWGGGVARVRPDGSELEVYSKYLRNICDIAITPTMDMFARDNTNDGKGWNTRFHHFVPMGDYGYPRLYQNFANETVMALKDYGGGSGTGALALNEPGFPKEYDNAIFTCDWTTGKIYQHDLTPLEATFSVTQEVFHPLTRATDIDVDGMSRLYLSDWRNGRFRYDPKQEVGMLHQVLPPNWEKREFPDLAKMTDEKLAEQMSSDSAVMRLEVQREIISRGPKKVFADRLYELAGDSSAHRFQRIAAIFTFKQLYGVAANGPLAKLVEDAAVREHVLRALADRKSQLEGVDPSLFMKYLKDENPRVQLQAMNGLARLDAKSAAPAILDALAGTNPDGGVLAEQERRVVPHVGIKALVELEAVEACLAAVSDESKRKVALRALQEMHLVPAVDGLIEILESSKDEAPAFDVLGALARLHYKEAEWDLKKWWFTRPDDRGPYFEPTEWAGTEKVAKALERAFGRVAEKDSNRFVSLLAKNRIAVSELELEGLDPLMIAVADQDPDLETMAVLIEAAKSPKRAWEERLMAYHSIERAKEGIAIPAMVSVLAAMDENGTPEAKALITDFVNDAQRGLQSNILNEIAKKGEIGESALAWKAMITVYTSPLSKEGFKKQVKKVLDKNPVEVGFFVALEEMKVAGFDSQIAHGMDTDNEKTRIAAKRAKDAIVSGEDSGLKVGEMEPAEAIAYALEKSGDKEKGERLYVSQGCIACHAVDPDAVQKGPYLGDAGAKFERSYLVESIIDPNAVVAQGFQSTLITTKDGNTSMGFVTGEVDGVIELRDIAGQVKQIERANVKSEQHLPQSMMPAGLANTLSADDFTSLIEYLVSLENSGG